MFQAMGNYGSTVFDPGGIPRDEVLQINICDECLVAHCDRVEHVTSKVTIVYDFKTWSPPIYPPM